MKKDDIFGGVILLIVIVMIGLFLYFAKSAPELSYGPVEIPGSALSVTTPAEYETKILATLVKPGFVTLHRSIGGAPGPIVGVSNFLNSGENIDVNIKLTAEMTKDEQFVLLLHVDNGDETFVVADDMPVTSNGESVRANFVSPGVRQIM